jgi:hypothetical protein
MTTTTTKLTANVLTAAQLAMALDQLHAWRTMYAAIACDPETTECVHAEYAARITSWRTQIIDLAQQLPETSSARRRALAKLDGTI